MTSAPSAFADALLRLFLRPDVFLTVSGDLLEQYRDSVLPTRGRTRAAAWYLRQAVAIALRKIAPWAALFAVVYVSRFAWDMLIPTTEFHTRSNITTYASIAILLAAGFFTAWRSGSFLAGLAAGLATITAAGILSAIGNATLLVFFHGAAEMSAIANSGGLDEAFLLPIFLIIPATTIGALGGLFGATARKIAKAA